MGTVVITRNAGENSVVTAPVGSLSINVRMWAGCGGGGAGSGAFGNGGGSGGFGERTAAISSGQTFTPSVGFGGAGGLTPPAAGIVGDATSVSGHFSMSTNGGQGGGTTEGSGGGGGAAGTGGDVNNPGNSTSTQTGAAHPNSGPGAGGNGNQDDAGGVGGDGRIVFTFTTVDPEFNREIVKVEPQRYVDPSAVLRGMMPLPLFVPTPTLGVVSRRVYSS